MNQYEREILETEKAFAKLAKEKGRKTAFLSYADQKAILCRNNRLIRGKREIAEYFDRDTMQEVQLEWEAEHVGVSASGDLGYTFGTYRYQGKKPSGETVRLEGIFHTVWKKAPDGEWRFVWD